MLLASHNSWSYLPPKHWWIRPFAFMARCQNVDIKTQYEKYGVRCFDLRILFDKDGEPCIAHGFCKYRYSQAQLLADLHWLNTQKEYCYIRVLHEIRRKSQYTVDNVYRFRHLCLELEETYKNLHFWCGRNLYNWEYDYRFSKREPTCHEDYSSVSRYKYIMGWWPWVYAKLFNNKIIKGSFRIKQDLLMVDYVNVT